MKSTKSLLIQIHCFINMWEEFDTMAPFIYKKSPVTQSAATTIIDTGEV